MALEAVKGKESLPKLSRKFEVSPIMISRWKGEFLAKAASVFTSASDAEKSTEDVEKLYAQIGKLKVEVDFLKKSLRETGDLKYGLRQVKPRTTLSIRKQCDLLEVSRSRLYYRPIEEKLKNLNMMELIDRHLMHHPTEGVRSMVHLLANHDFHVNVKRIRRFFRIMGYNAIYQRKNLSKLGAREYIRPYQQISLTYQ